MANLRSLALQLIHLVTVVGISLAGALSSDAGQEGRLASEARALFKGVDRGASSRCKFDAAWDSRPVLAETAVRYLKLSVHADLVVSEPPATPMQIIDQAGHEADAFCTAEERAAAWREAVSTFQGQNGGALRLTSTGYGFPVFNADYTRAALVVQHFSETHHRSTDGTLQRSLEMSGGAVIFAKRRGVWKRIDYDSYYTGH